MGRQGFQQLSPTVSYDHRSPMPLLTPLQWQFLSIRMLCRSDTEAAKRLKIRQTTVSHWYTRDEDFKAALLRIHHESMQVVKDMIMAHTGAATQVLVEALVAVDGLGMADWTTRIKAAELLLKAGEVVGSRVTVAGDPNNPIQVQVTADDLYEALKQARAREAIPGEVRVLEPGNNGAG